jgi:3-keto-5-aminohexanoate cleavage enzyme
MAYEDKVIITVAVNGILTNRSHHPALPYSAVEIAEEVYRAYNAGASVAHIHARDDDGLPTFETEAFAAIKREVRARCPIILNFSTGNMDMDTTKQQRYIHEVKPDFAALNMGTMNYAKYSEKRKEFVFDMVFPNPFEKIIGLLKAMNEAGVRPELECFDTGHTNSIGPLYDMGVLKKPTQFSFIMGVLGGLPQTVEALQLQASQVPAGGTWEVIGIGRQQWRLVAAALTIGGNIRVGLEDNFYLPDGSLAAGNGALVERAARLSRDIGREPATVEEARKLFSLD